MPWGVAAAVASSAIGAIAGGGGQQTQQQSNNAATPWDPQSTELQNAYNNADATLLQRQLTPYNQYYSATNPMQTNAVNNINGTAQNDQGSGGYLAAINAGLPLLGQAGTYANNAANFAQTGIGQQDPRLTSLLTNYATTGNLPGQSGANPALANGVTNASLGALGSLGQGANVANQVAQTGLNPQAAMNGVVQGANSYINNPVLQGQIDALGTDISRNLNNTTLPGIRAAALANGNTNSSREGALEGIAGSQAQENLLNAASQIRGNAYNTGASLANNQYSTGLNAAGTAANTLNANGYYGGSLANNQQQLQQQQGQFDTTARLGAANNQQSQNLGYNTANTQAMLAGNAQLGTGIGYGTNALSTGLNGQLTDANAMLTAGNTQQQLQQADLNAADTRNQSILNDYFNIGSRGYNGANSSTSATSQTSGAGLAGATMGGLGGLITGNNLSGALGGNNSGGIFGGGQTGSGGFLGTLFNGGQGSMANNFYAAANPAYGVSGGAGTSALQNMGFLGQSLSGAW